MREGEYSFTWDSGAQATWRVNKKGTVIYERNDKEVLRVNRDTWKELVAAMADDPLPREEIPLVGEIVGWRCWRWHDHQLWSLTRRHIWLPDDIQHGHVGDESGGIYAFKTKSHAYSEAHKSYAEDGNECPWVVGSVSLWGDAIEAADGWRAEYAKVTSIDTIMISKLAHKRYGKRPDPVEQKTTRLWGLVSHITHVIQEPIPLDGDALLSALRAKYLTSEPGDPG